MKYILTIDQGTTSSRAAIFSHDGHLQSISNQEFTQIFPKPGHVEHDPEEIWTSQLNVIHQTLRNKKLSSKDIAALGITNQRETTVVWNKKTGKPIYNAIVWQDRRTSELCKKLKEQGLESTVRSKTGLTIDPYFSATKIRWILDHVEGAQALAQSGELAFGTIDSWLMWKLTGGTKHFIEISNASRTLLFNIHTSSWDNELLKIFNIPPLMMPEVHSSSEIYAYTDKSLFDPPIAIAGCAGDQQAALFGQRCIKTGMVKNTYGTGCFMLMNIGTKPIASEHNLVTTVAWKIGSSVQYALEGSVFIAGAVVQWLRDELKIIPDSKSIEPLAKSVADNGGVYFVPAFSGLGAPHWDPFARGAILGLTRGSNVGHIARAALESIAYQTADVIHAMEADTKLKIKEMRVDGAASQNNLLMQFQADILNSTIVRPKIWEISALGAAYLAGLAVGYWNNQDEIDTQWSAEKIYSPNMDQPTSAELLKNWNKALSRSTQWTET